MTQGVLSEDMRNFPGQSRFVPITGLRSADESFMSLTGAFRRSENAKCPDIVDMEQMNPNRRAIYHHNLLFPLQ